VARQVLTDRGKGRKGVFAPAAALDNVREHEGEPADRLRRPSIGERAVMPRALGVEEVRDLVQDLRHGLVRDRDPHRRAHARHHARTTPERVRTAQATAIMRRDCISEGLSNITCMIVPVGCTLQL
jgi:hypothetical protein